MPVSDAGMVTVTSTDAPFQQTAWLFTRGTESVHAEVREAGEGFELLVNGPGTATAAYTFPDLDSLDEFRGRQEKELIAGGFKLQAVTERRSSPERRQGSRPPLKDRRRR